MKTKTIKQVLRKKFDDFAKSITDERVRKLVEDGTEGAPVDSTYLMTVIDRIF